jgi:hypothetical protein
MWSLRRWWRALWRSGAGPAAVDPVPAEPRTGARSGVVADADRPIPPPARRYHAPLPDADPRREAHLGAVLQALAIGPTGRDELSRRVGAADWGPGRLDAVVDHGLAAGVLLEDDDGAVRLRYPD